MEEEDNIIVKWAQEDVETSYSLLNNNNKRVKNFNTGWLFGEKKVFVFSHQAVASTNFHSINGLKLLQLAKTEVSFFFKMRLLAKQITVFFDR